MGLVLPDEQGSIDVWGGLLNSIFGATKIDGHDHSTGKGVKIPSAALNINADVAWSASGTNRAITGLKAAAFTPQAASSVSSYAAALFWNSDDSNNLYARTYAGANVKILDGATLNVAAFVGGIGGDYSSVSALLDYDDATDTYRFRQEVNTAVRQYAKLKSADISLFEYKAAGVTPVPSFTVTLKSPAALAASYSVTMPAAVPSETTAMEMSSTGQITVGRRTKTMFLGPSSWKAGTSSIEILTDWTFRHTSTTNDWRTQTGTSMTSTFLYADIQLNAGDIITAMNFYVDKGSDNTNSLFASLEEVVATTGAATSLATATTSANGTGAATVPFATTLPQTIAATKYYRVRMGISDSSPNAVDKIYGISVTYTTA